MSARPSRPGREASTFTLDPRTVARLTKLSELTGWSRGRLVDFALESIEPCATCRGTRQKAEGERCATCGGIGLLPSES